MHYLLIGLVVLIVSLVGGFTIYSFFAGIRPAAKGTEDGTRWFLFTKNGKVGYKDPNDVVVISPRYDAGNPFSEGLALVQYKGKYGYIDPGGNLTIAWTDESRGDFSFGLAPAEKQQKWGFIDQKGAFSIQPKWETVNGFTEEFAVVKGPEGFGFINTDGNVVATPNLDALRDCVEGFFVGQKAGKWGILKHDGSWLLEPQYAYISDFEGGKAIVHEQIGADMREGIVRSEGRIMWTDKLDALNAFNQNAQKLEKATLQLMETYTRNGCPCRYPRFRRVVEFQGAAVICMETDFLAVEALRFYVQDNSIPVEKIDGVVTAYLGCKVCGSTWRSGKETFSGGLVSRFLKLEDDHSGEQIGKAVTEPVPLFLGFKGPSRMEEFEDGFQKVSLQEYVSYMSAKE